VKLRTLATIAMLFACVASAALAGEGLLRRAWMERMPDRAALLREAQRRFNALVPEWDAAEPERVRTGAWWFVDHRDVSYLVLDQELAALPKGPRRSLALYLTGRLAARPLGS